MYKYLLVEGLLEKDDPTDGFDPLFVTGEEQLTELAPVHSVLYSIHNIDRWIFSFLLL